MYIKITYLTKSQNVKTKVIDTTYVQSTEVDQELGTISFLIDGVWVQLLCTNVIGLETGEQTVNAVSGTKRTNWTTIDVEKNYDCGEMQYAIENMVWDNAVPKSIGEVTEM